MHRAIHGIAMTQHPSFLAATLLALACTGALAQSHDRDHDRAPPAHGGPTRPAPAPGHAAPGWSGGHARGYVDFDARYGHNHYYPSHGFVYGSLPMGAVSVGFGGGNYFFHGGVWFRPYGARYVVVQPPIGIYVPMLPPAYATVWIGGLPYYYADGVYYNAAPGRGYVVVAAPPGADAAAATAPPAPDPIFYPRSGQSAAQLEADRRDCNTWATTQPNAMADAKVFQRATEACMDGRGYTVR